MRSTGADDISAALKSEGLRPSSAVFGNRGRMYKLIKRKEICPSGTFYSIKSLNELDEAHSLSEKIISSIFTFPIQMAIPSINTLKARPGTVFINYP